MQDIVPNNTILSIPNMVHDSGEFHIYLVNYRMQACSIRYTTSDVLEKQVDWYNRVMESASWNPILCGH